MNTTPDWTTRAFPPPLRVGEVQVWRVLVPDADGLPSRWADLLTPDEQANAARKRIPHDARRTVASRACLRLLLGRYLDVRPTAITLTTNATGKPQLAAPVRSPRLEFNVSHSGDWLVLAFASGMPVGIDVECHRELEYGDLVNSFFSPQERSTWSSVPAADHAAVFFSAWTRKEAYLKALGLGLAKPLDSFAVAFEGDPASALLWCASDESAPRHWRLMTIPLAPHHACALAVGSAATAVHTFTFEEACRR